MSIVAGRSFRGESPTDKRAIFPGGCRKSFVCFSIRFRCILYIYSTAISTTGLVLFSKSYIYTYTQKRLARVFIIGQPDGLSPRLSTTTGGVVADSKMIGKYIPQSTYNTMTFLG